MNTFIKKHEYNYIKRCLKDLKNSFKGCVDNDIIAASKIYIQDKIFSVFSSLSEDEKALLDITNLTKSTEVDEYLVKLEEYVYGMQKITDAQLKKLFKKEKKLKLPNQEDQDSKNVYLGWVDESVRKLFIAYKLNDNLVGMSCRISNPDPNAHICVLCNRIGKESEVAFVSPICKTSNSFDGAYKSIGFDICLDSSKCNDRIESVEKLEKILKEVNDIK